MSTGIRVRLPRPQLLQIKKGAARIAYEEQEPLAKLAETSSGFCERLKWRKWILVETRELAPAFRHVRLLLARDKGHPDGDREEGYDLLLPIDRRLPRSSRMEEVPGILSRPIFPEGRDGQDRPVAAQARRPMVLRL